MKLRAQPLRPRTQKNPGPRNDFSRTDPLEAKDRNAQGPRTQGAIVLEKKVPQIFFQATSKKKVFALKDVEFPQKIRRSPKQKSSQFFCEVSAVFQGKVKRRSWQKCCYRAEDRSFSRTCRFGGQGQNLTFEVKAQNFKMCSRGRFRDQGRPRGLHFC